MKTYSVVGIGNAIVDVFAQTDDAFLARMGIGKGIMQLVERERGAVPRTLAAIEEILAATGATFHP